MRQWINNYEFVGALRLDPHAKGIITSTHKAPYNVFDIPRPEGAAPVRITGFSSFVTTRATAYCFLPSLTALRFIAKL